MCAVTDADVIFATNITSTPDHPASIEFFEVIMEQERILTIPSTVLEALDLYIRLVCKIEQSLM